MANPFTYADINIGEVAAQLYKSDAAASRNLIGEVVNFTPPSMTRNVTPFDTAFGTIEIEGSVQAIRTSIATRGYVPELLDYYQPSFGPAATPELPHLEVAQLLRTDTGVGDDVKLLIGAIHGRLISRVPGQTTVGSVTTYTWEFMVSKYVEYIIHAALNDARTGYVRRADDASGGIISQTDDAPAGSPPAYSDKTKAPDLYYHPRLGHWFERGENVWAQENALSSFGTLLTPSSG